MEIQSREQGRVGETLRRSQGTQGQNQWSQDHQKLFRVREARELVEKAGS